MARAGEARGGGARGEGEERRGWPGCWELSHPRWVQAHRTGLAPCGWRGAGAISGRGCAHSPALACQADWVRTNPAQQQPRVSRVGSEQVLSAPNGTAGPGEPGAGGEHTQSPPRPAENRKRQRNRQTTRVAGRGESQLCSEPGPSANSSFVFEQVRRQPPQASVYPFVRTPPALQDRVRSSEMTLGHGARPRGVTPALGLARLSPPRGCSEPPLSPLLQAPGAPPGGRPANTCG